MIYVENEEKKRINEYWQYAEDAVRRRDLKTSLKCLMIISKTWKKIEKNQTIQMLP